MNRVMLTVLVVLTVGVRASSVVAQEGTVARAGEPVVIALDERFRAGDAEAPVVLTIYACGRSELCARSIPLLYEKVTTGRFKGKVRLYYRPFFPEGQAEAARCGRALVAAAGQGMFWPYLLTLYAHDATFQSCMLRRWAEETGLDTCAFQLAVEDPKTTEYLTAVQQEAARNHVDATPSAFLDGKKIEGELSVDRIVGLLARACDDSTR